MERPRRNRRTESLRALMRETWLAPQHLVYPVFIQEGQNRKDEIRSMPGQFRLSLDELDRICHQVSELGLAGVALFPAIDAKLKSPAGEESFNPEGLVPRALQLLKKNYPQLTLISDVALDPYSSDGHDGVVQNGIILNDETVEILCRQAVSQARAGADLIAPSDMMDGRIGAIRKALDSAGFQHVGILSYCAKYASKLYGPFRDALDSAPKFGDKKTYQMDPANRREAEREARLDVQEGADILMVKPALAYLDVIQLLRQKTDLPIAAYQVSGEYAMIQAAAKNGWIDGPEVLKETLLSIRRAGADVIFSYGALDIARRL